MAEAKKSVKLFVSYAHPNRIQWIIKDLSCPYSVLVTGGVDVGDIDNVIRINHNLPNLVIIDERIVYYGEINPFVYGKKEGTIMRIEDPTLAKQIRESLMKSY